MIRIFVVVVVHFYHRFLFSFSIFLVLFSFLAFSSETNFFVFSFLFFFALFASRGAYFLFPTICLSCYDALFTKPIAKIRERGE